MENELKFNSQVCTTKEQSQRLLDLGLKPETADMQYSRSYYNSDGEPVFIVQILENLPKTYRLIEGCIPAWSLHRLIELYSDIEDTSSLCIKNVSYKLLIFCIEKAIHCGFFNKEYLKQ